VVAVALLLQLRVGWSVLKVIGAAAAAGLLQAVIARWWP
jgi:hypothetical protein